MKDYNLSIVAILATLISMMLEYQRLPTSFFTLSTLFLALIVYATALFALKVAVKAFEQMWK